MGMDARLQDNNSWGRGGLQSSFYAECRTLDAERWTLDTECRTLNAGHCNLQSATCNLLSFSKVSGMAEQILLFPNAEKEVKPSAICNLQSAICNLPSLFTLCFILIFSLSLSAQDEPKKSGSGLFLTIDSDARASGMGGAGVAVFQRTSSIFYNASTSLLGAPGFNFSYSYTPWMREWASGSMLMTASGYYRFNKQSIAVGFRHFTHPNTPILDQNGNITGDFKPKEWSVDAAYSHFLTDNLGGSVTLRYIRSDLGSQQGVANAFAFDIGMIYRDYMNIIEGGYWSIGLNVFNVGSKLKYDDNSYEMPARISLGAAAFIPLAEHHQLRGALDLNYQVAPADYTYLNAGIGIEYILYRYGVLRGGYHAGNRDKGDENYATLGAGLRLPYTHVDFSYRITESDSPLKNTWNLSIGFHL